MTVPTPAALRPDLRASRLPAADPKTVGALVADPVAAGRLDLPLPGASATPSRWQAVAEPWPDGTGAWPDGTGAWPDGTGAWPAAVNPQPLARQWRVIAEGPG
ncbi:MAG: hypothetical protein ACRDU8_00690 [Egibacteraceae bacterium]